MGSIEEIPAQESLETIIVWGPCLRTAFERWGSTLRLYNGKSMGNVHADVVSNYLGMWMDNGAYYYYNPLPNKNYEDTILEIKENLTARNVPIRYVNYDSWFYEKGFLYIYILLILILVTSYRCSPDTIPVIICRKCSWC